MPLNKILALATEILGEKEAKIWLFSKIPSLDNQVPVNLLNTKYGQRLVEQTLLQIKFGIYA
jgi:uncharacterized protein (DUF2384 family)